MNEVVQFAGDKDQQKEKASAPILSQLKASEKVFREWDDTCCLIDDVYSKHGASYERLMNMYGGSEWQDAEMDLFWSSSEVLKPAIYAKPPVPAVAPIFNDTGKLKSTTAELLERSAISTFKQTGIDEVMCNVRDDLIFTNRGVMWLRLEDKDGKRVCVEHKDRDDFRHEPARKWSEVGWVAGAAWMSRDEMKKRFPSLTKGELDQAKFYERRDEDNREEAAMSSKAKVWEVWHRANDRVYWVTDGIDRYLDDDKPHLKLDGFFPCPRPAYGTLRRRSLIPVPDFERYSGMFSKINSLTGRIYLLLERVRMVGLIPGGGDVGDAIKRAMADNSDEFLIEVPGMALQEGGTGMVWMPLAELAAAITGLIEARRQLIEDFYQLSGISDIMRGATEAEETLGAQQLKAQYGSVRVRCKIDELQRIAADAVKIAAEIIAEEFDGKRLLEMSQMELPTSADLKKRIKEIEDAAEKELEALSKRAEQMAQEAGPQIPPEQKQQAQQMFAQEQQAILQKYGPMLEEAEGLVPIDDVVDLLRDDKARSFAFEIETDSTILTDELAEKQSRADFIQAFNGATQGLMSIAGMGEAGASLAGEMLKFSLAPYRAGRQLSSAIDEFVKQAPAMIAAQQAEGGDEGLGALADAEKLKAQAAMERVQAQREKDQAESALKAQELQRKIGELQQKAASEVDKARLERDGMQIKLLEAQSKAEKSQAEIDKIRAETIKALSEAGVIIRSQNLDEFKSLADLEFEERQSQEAAMTGGEGEPQNGEQVNDIGRIEALIVEQGRVQNEALARLAQIVGAPTELVRDEQGRPVGARKVTNG